MILISAYLMYLLHVACKHDTYKREGRRGGGRGEGRIKLPKAYPTKPDKLQGDLLKKELPVRGAEIVKGQSLV